MTREELFKDFTFNEKPDTVITEVNGMEVKTMEQLKDVLSYIRGGSTGTVKVQERVEGEYEPKEYEVVFAARGKQ